MATSVRLDGKTEKLVEDLARGAGRTKSDVIREAIAAYGRGKRPRRARNLLEGIAPFVGVAAGGPPDLSERTGEAFLSTLAGREVRRTRKGRGGRRKP